MIIREEFNETLNQYHMTHLMDLIILLKTQLTPLTTNVGQLEADHYIKYLSLKRMFRGDSKHAEIKTRAHK